VPVPVQERAHFDNLSDLYSLVVAMEHLEKAYIRESIEPDEYTKMCSQLLAQFKTCKEAVLKQDAAPVGSGAAAGGGDALDRFFREFLLEETCRQAINRLKEGVPATVRAPPCACSTCSVPD
jgi:ESCRT-I complex subunit VPS28